MRLSSSKIVGDIVHVSDVFGTLSDANFESTVHSGKPLFVKGVL